MNVMEITWAVFMCIWRIWIHHGWRTSKFLTTSFHTIEWSNINVFFFSFVKEWPQTNSRFRFSIGTYWAGIYWSAIYLVTYKFSCKRTIYSPNGFNIITCDCPANTLSKRFSFTMVANWCCNRTKRTSPTTWRNSNGPNLWRVVAHSAVYRPMVCWLSLPPVCSAHFWYRPIYQISIKSYRAKAHPHCLKYWHRLHWAWAAPAASLPLPIFATQKVSAMSTDLPASIDNCMCNVWLFF